MIPRSYRTCVKTLPTVHHNSLLVYCRCCCARDVFSANISRGLFSPGLFFLAFLSKQAGISIFLYNDLYIYIYIIYFRKCVLLPGKTLRVNNFRKNNDVYQLRTSGRSKSAISDFLRQSFIKYKIICVVRSRHVYRRWPI